MAKYMCLRKVRLNVLVNRRPGPITIRGEQIIGASDDNNIITIFGNNGEQSEFELQDKDKRIPKQHFQQIEGDSSRSLFSILKGKLEKHGVFVEDFWEVTQMERMLAEKEAEGGEKEQRKELQKLLKENSIKFHHAMGLKKLQMIARGENLLA